MNRYFLSISFKGTNYHGWQVQPNANTVQAELNKWLSTLFKEDIETVGCGRTDAGVHAKAFVLHFDTVQVPEDMHHWIYKLNQVLPHDISVLNCYPVKQEEHARFSALSRTYKYFIHQQKDPFLNETSYYLTQQLQIELMNKGCELLMQHTDFTSFSKLHTDVQTNNCKIMRANWFVEGHQLIFTIQADRFLRNMVRAIVGTLLDVGKGKISLEELEKIILGKDRGKAGVSVPAHGLFFWGVEY
jgi:tRNA pseudouridine38-40 synthase